MSQHVRRPDWLKLRPLDPAIAGNMGRLLRGLKLHTVCESAQCPNRTECFGKGTATFMILGSICTRNCTFCAVEKGKTLPPDPQEPAHVLEAVRKLGLKYVVITSVTRDDLSDGGASQFAETVNKIQGYDSSIVVEVLIPDFQGSLTALPTVIDAQPTVINHNIETVPRLYREVRPKANYQRSLRLLKFVKEINLEVLTKSGLMLGLGESREEVTEVMRDLRAVSCDFLTIGQYLQPSFRHHELVRYVSPDEFQVYNSIGRELGFTAVVGGPLVRSSFHAADMFLSTKKFLERVE